MTVTSFLARIGGPLHQLMGCDARRRHWVAPDAMGVGDLIGLDVRRRSASHGRFHAEVDPPDWPLSRVLESVVWRDEHATELFRFQRNHARVLLLWPEREGRARAPCGVFVFRMHGRLNHQQQLEQVIVHPDACWLAPEYRGQGISHYFAGFLRAFVFWHPLNGELQSSVSSVPVGLAGFSVKLMFTSGSTAWQRVCANLEQVFAMNHQLWAGRLTDASTGHTALSARWAVSAVASHHVVGEADVVPLRA